MRCPTGHMHYDLLDRVVRLERFNFSFAIVRNPFDRAVSDYHWANRNADVTGRASFYDWLKWTRAQYEKDPFFLDNHIRPQSHFVGPKINRVYKYEDGIHEILASVLRRVGFRTDGQTIAHRVPHKNRRQSHTDQPYTDQHFGWDISAAREFEIFYKNDFENFYPNL